MCVMFFNVQDVKEFLLEEGYVYTLRKKRFRIGNDIAVVGSYYKHKKIARIHIEFIKSIHSFLELVFFVAESGLVPKDIADNRKGVASLKWFDLAKKMSKTYPLYLYKVKVIDDNDE